MDGIEMMVNKGDVMLSCLLYCLSVGIDKLLFDYLYDVGGSVRSMSML